MLIAGLILCALSAVSLGAKFPENQEKCRIGNSKCIVRVANEVVARALNGYPELGLPVLDPLRIEKMNVDQGGDGPVNLKISLRNINLIGLSGTRFTKIEGFRQNIDRSKIEIRFVHPVMRIEGPYKLNGKVLVLPVQGSGIANISLSGVNGVMKILTKKVVKQGKSYLQIDKSKLNFDVEHAQVNFEGLYNGNKALGDSTNLFFNENWRDILKELKPALGQSFGAIYTTLINSVFGSIPYEETLTN